MINLQGIVQNNQATTDLINSLKRSKNQYKTQNKTDERAMIEEFCELETDENGNTIMDENTKEFQKYIEEEDILKKIEKYWLVPRKIKWKKDSTELINLLTMHNIRCVFSIAKNYCHNTVDMDNMVGKGIFGLVFAANNFNLFTPILEVKNTRGEMGPKYNGDKIDCVKFITYAHNWIYKYVVGEFYDRSIIIDNNSISINDPVRIKNSIDNDQTMENYVNSMIAPETIQPKTIEDELSNHDTSNFYKMINSYINSTNELTAMEKNILIETYYNNHGPKYISDKYDINQSYVTLQRKKALSKVKKFLNSECNINSVNEIF